MKSSIFVKFQLAGIHRWEECPFEDVDYLRNDHRHQFFFEFHAEVNHDNRDIEFIKLQYELKRHLIQTFWDGSHNCLMFGKMSCEMIGKYMLEHFDFLSKAIVSEDNENGAIVLR